MGMDKIRKAARKGKHKKKCCRDNPRCKTCAVVLKRLDKQGAFALDDAALAKALKKARRW
ncbi:hypothetical protein CULCOIPH003_09940 [Corynebacterium ulcerans]|uniref:30S ribosomal protein S14 n=1 Tax=Corynebacterium ulcerans TaxID=65058 RepID=A0ABD0BFT5_CORUL|nr:hypothetical protein [Corynebacterium ulcerans]GJJ38363.1 hypothetical protein CULCOIPH003_09940 [Corynebacterium ulcerans]GJJ42713.1 hypothetical protein CULCOIPH005_09020 [Corynebacterium ulcerans]